MGTSNGARHARGTRVTAKNSYCKWLLLPSYSFYNTKTESNESLIFTLHFARFCSECAKMMVSFHENAGTGKLTGVHKKYSTSKYGYAAKIEPAVFLLNDAEF